MAKEQVDPKKIMGIIDDTKLKPFETFKSIKELIMEANELQTYSVCIEPIFLDFAREYIKSEQLKLKIAVVVDFPFGVNTTAARLEMLKNISVAADELDVVVQIGYVKSNRFDLVERDLTQLVKLAHEYGRVIKVIVEDAYTTLDEKKKLYVTVMKSNADFIKTGTGFEDEKYALSLNNKVGALAENIKLMAEMSRVHNPEIGIKGAGGIRTYNDVINLLESSEREPEPNRFRIGTSSARKIMESAPSH
jgi:deoxyribose-phosphate aldolase